MKNRRSLITSLVLCVVFFGIVVSQALALPLLDFQGKVYVDIDGIADPLNTTKVTSWTDEVGWDGDIVNPFDPIVGQYVSGFSSSFDYDFSNDFLTVSPSASGTFYVGSADGTDPYLTATVSKFTVTKLGNYEYTIDAYLSDQQYFHTDTSTFMAQYEANSPLTGIQASLMTWDVVIGLPTEPRGYDYYINVSGKVTPVPEPGTLLLLGSGLLGLCGYGYRRKKK